MSYERLFVTFSMRRSGQHAVLNWVCRQLQAEGVTHFNNCGVSQRRAGLRRFRRYAVIEPLNGRFLVYTRGGVMDSSLRMKHSWMPSLWYLNAIARARTTRQTRHAIYSFEGTDICRHEDLKDIMKWLPCHQNLTVAIITRDPYNWLASTLQRGYPIESITEKVRLWKQHVRECLGETNLLGLPLVDVNFNRWTQEAPYRAELARRLAIPYSEKGVDEVPTIGGGSSFNRTAFDGMGSHMQVLDRWLKFRENPHFLRVAECPEIRRLCRRYFGFSSPPEASPPTIEGDSNPCSALQSTISHTPLSLPWLSH